MIGPIRSARPKCCRITARLSLLILSVLASAFSTAISFAETPGSEAEVVVGIAGHYRPGRWTGLRVVKGENVEERASVIETRDGDGVRVAYGQVAPLSIGTWGYAIPGSEATPLIIRGESETLLSTRFPTLGSPSRGESMIPRKMPWIVAFVDALGVDKIGANKLLNRDALMAVSTPKSAAGFPDRVFGYDGVDLMILGASSREKLAALNEDQQSAISQWITGGGRVFLTLGESGPELLQAAPWLLELLPISADDLTIVKLNPSAIETYTSSQTPLRTFGGVRLPRGIGTTLITGRTTRRISVPVAAEYNVGLGSIIVVAADLENELFAAWPQRLDLITRLTGTILIPEQDEASVQSRATAYDDLVGQTRATLDQFSIKRSFGFSFLSLILMALIAAIGPLDYLLINRVFGRPLLGWLSVPLIAIGLSLILVQQSRPVAAESENAGDHDSGQRLNRIEFVDIDTTAGLGRGCSLSALYSHPANLLDVNVMTTPSLDSICEKMDWVLTTPFGYPGESFGGIQIAIEDARLPPYLVSPLQVDGEIRGSLDGLPLAPRSSKSMITRYRFRPQLKSVRVSRRAGVQLLQGELINPLPVDLLNGMLIYQNSVYLLPTRFPVGDRIDSVEDLRPKDFRWHLSRQKALEENATETEQWDPAMTDSPQRVAEMLMFHAAVGGERYTTLTHDALAFLDLTHVLTDDRCMLVGKVAKPMTRLTTSNGTDNDHEPDGQALTIVRLVLPVEAAASR